MRSPNKLCPSVYPDKPCFHLLLNPISLQLQHFYFLFFIGMFPYFILFFFCKMTLIYPKAQLLKFRNGNYQGMKPVSFLLSWQVLSQLPCHHLGDETLMVKETLMLGSVCGTRWLLNTECGFWVIVWKQFWKSKQTKVEISREEGKKQGQVRAKQIREGSGVRISVEHR